MIFRVSLGVSFQGVKLVLVGVCLIFIFEVSCLRLPKTALKLMGDKRNSTVVASHILLCYIKCSCWIIEVWSVIFTVLPVIMFKLAGKKKKKKKSCIPEMLVDEFLNEVWEK